MIGKKVYSKFEYSYPLIMDSINELVSIVEPNYDFKIEDINEYAYQRLLGYNSENLIGKSILNYIHLDDVKKAVKFLKNSKIKSRVQEIRLKHIDGTYIWCEVNARIFVKENNQKKILVISRDISERKLLEQKLKDSENRFKKLSGSVPEIQFWKLFTPKKFGDALQQSYEMLRMVMKNIPQYIFWKDKNLVYLGCNENYAKFIGVDLPENIIGKRDLELFDGREQVNKLLKNEISIINSKKAEIHIEESWFLKNGVQIWLDVNRIPLRDNKGNVLGILVTYEDITEKREAEEKLRESEERFRSLVETTSDWIWEVDQNGVYTYSSPKVKDILGYELDEIIGKTPFDLMPPQEAERVGEIFQKIVDMQGPFDALENINIHKDGHNVVLETSGVPIFDSNRNFLGYRGIDRDITERKKAEGKLKESEEKYRLISENANDLIAILDQEFNLQYINEDTYKRILGYSNEDMLGKTRHDIIHPEDLKTSMKILRDGYKKGEGTGELRLRHKNGQYIWLETKGRLFRDSEGRTKALTISRDITARKKAEEELRKAKNFSESIIDSLPGIYYFFNKEGKFLRWNNNFEEISEYSAEEISRMKLLDFFTGEDKRILAERIQEVFIKGRSTAEGDFISKSGKKMSYYFTGLRIMMEDTPYLGGMGIDITERKEAEGKLKESEEKYRHLFENSPYLILLFDQETKKLIDSNNKSIGGLIGDITNENIGDNFIEIISQFKNSKDFIKLLRKRAIAADRGKVLDPVEIPLVWENGITTWVSLNGSNHNIGGKKISQAIISDITERKKAEEKIEKQNEFLINIIESLTHPFYVINADNYKIEIANSTALPDQYSGIMTCYAITHKLDKPCEGAHTCPLEIVKNTKKPVVVEHRHIDKYNEIKDYEVHGFPIFDKEGNVIQMIEYTLDITEKKMYEKLIEELNINFLHFSTNNRENIHLLLNTCCKLLDAEVVIYSFKSLQEDKDYFHIITSNNELLTYDLDYFKENIFLNEFLYDKNDISQIILNLQENKYVKTDPFLINYNVSGAYGKLIRLEKEFKTCLCAFFQENPVLKHQDQMILFLISDALEIERGRWQVKFHLEEQNKKLNELNKLRREFLSRTSHELKTPLISIKGFTELLLTTHQSKLDTDMKSIMEEVKNGCSRLEKIINSLLEATRLDQNKLELTLATENLSFLIKFCVNELKGLAEVRELKIIQNFSKNLATILDKERIYDVLSNLIINAIKYTPPGGEIIIDSEIQEKSLIISVKDNGIGLTEEEKNKLFTQFGKIERYGQGWDVETEGSGLGLYISKGIVELHGGKIWVESEGRNKGSTFYFSLPFIE